ncbi:vitamin K epoxide reductase family protein [Solirubrobacter phytolaccae]|uniref:Vitamin K epoxide reductase family protein n=1 Tax=Solirubrobacter phytolaccae TaxID=1404360 RepID=A0A9X3NBX6_9ACTN|nr:vitamin K epoxide reductase family protein [Solirubrobacter phytolaccae]MDA0183106.1 vitamin K epoxide reductase family protein [Solirubrobacter phytolaccae]
MVHYAGLEPFCVGGGGGCERVQSSEYAELFGVPVAVLGLGGYLALLGSLALPDELSRTSAAFVALVGAAFSLYLTYVEIAEIQAICQWCVVSAVLMVALAGVSVARLSRTPSA